MSLAQLVGVAGIQAEKNKITLSINTNVQLSKKVG
jgi:hypothetical protein